jgi:hypothetical protein
MGPDVGVGLVDSVVVSELDPGDRVDPEVSRSRLQPPTATDAAVAAAPARSVRRLTNPVIPAP